MGGIRQLGIVIFVLAALLLSVLGGFYLIGPVLFGTEPVPFLAARSSPVPTLTPPPSPSATEEPSPTPGDTAPPPTETAVPAATATDEPTAAPTESPSPAITVSPLLLSPTAEPTAAPTWEPTADPLAWGAGILLAPERQSVSEVDGAASITIALNSAPLTDVLVPLTTSSDRCTVTADQVTLTRENWLTGVIVLVLAHDDRVAQGDEPCQVIPGPSISGAADYRGIVGQGIEVTLLDDDVAGIVVSPAQLAVSEPAGTASFTVTLTSEPLSAVRIPLYGTDGQCSAGAGEIQLDPGNWEQGVRVLVTAGDDQIVDGEQRCWIQTGAASSAGADYDQRMSDDVEVMVADDDTGSVLVSPASLSVSEPAGAAAFRVSLGTQPLAPVSLPLTTGSDECQVSPAEVTLDATNWQTGVEVQVSARDDRVVDGEQTCLVLPGAAVSSGIDYAGMPATGVEVAVLDDDTAGILVSPLQIALSEPAGSAFFTITLTSQPLDAVTIPLYSSDEQCVVSAEAAVLDGANWEQGAIVQVTLRDDKVAGGERVCWVQTGASLSGGPDYNQLLSEDVAAAVTDDDLAGILVEPVELSLTETEGAAEITVSLSSQPLERVVVRARSEGQTVAEPSELTFTDQDWYVPRTVTVKAADDEVAEGEHSSLVLLKVSSHDAGYAALAAPEVAAQILDDDSAGVVVTPTQIVLLRGDAPETYQIVLTSEPVEPVTVRIESDEHSQVSPRVVTFTAQDWRQPQTVTVHAAGDGSAAATSGVTHHLSSADPVYAAMEPHGVLALIVGSTAGGASARTEAEAAGRAEGLSWAALQGEGGRSAMVPAAIIAFATAAVLGMMSLFDRWLDGILR